MKLSELFCFKLYDNYFVVLTLGLVSPTVLLSYLTSVSKGTELIFPAGDNSFIMVLHALGHFQM